MTNIAATTRVCVELEGRRATIADLQDALDTFKNEGIPDTFEVDLHQSQDREYIEDVPHSERPVTHRLWIEAERAAVQS